MPTVDGHQDTPPAEPLTVAETEISAGDLHLRPWEPRDVADLVAVVEDPGVERWNPFPDGPDPRTRAEAFVAARADWAAGGHASFAVLDSTTAAVLGSVSLFRLRTEDGRRLGETGFWVVPAARGRGVASRAVGAATRWAVGTLGLDRLELFHAVENVASCGVATRAGYPLERTTARTWRYGDGRLHDEHRHALLRPA